MSKLLFRPIHGSWLISLFCCGLLIGVVLARHGRLVWPSQGLALSFFFLAWAFYKHQVVFIGVILLAGLSFGLWRGGLEAQAVASFKPLMGKMITVQGKIAEDVTIASSGQVQLYLSEPLQVENKQINGRIWLGVRTKLVIKRSDIVMVSGELAPGFGTVPATLKHATLLDIKRTSSDVALKVRDWFSEGVKLSLPEPESLLGLGYLTGQRSALPKDFEEELRVVGLTHAVVASGYNLTILVGLGRRLFLSRSKYWATVSAVTMIIGFILVTGFSPSMTRAGLVAGLSLWAWYYGRAIHPFILLPVAAAITVIIEPTYAWGDLGWCLSFLAFAGVIIIAPLIKSYLWGAKDAPVFLQLIVETVAAQIATLPLILMMFGQFPTYALIANLVIVPLVPLTMFATFLSGLTGVIMPGLAGLGALPAFALLHFMVGTIHLIAQLPGSQYEVLFGFWMVLASYACIISAGWWLTQRTKYRFGRQDELLR